MREKIQRGEVTLTKDEVPVDVLPIVMKEVEFQYMQPSEGNPGTRHFQGLNLEVEQGTLNAIVGPPSQGKATMLRLLCGQVFPMMADAPPPSADPDAPPPVLSQLFTPPHLRIVQIQENPMIMGPEESIFDNLIFGFKKSPSLDLVALEKRALKVMAALGFSTELMGDKFKEHNFIGVGGSKLTRSDRQLISIGRALIMNPEMLIVHKPTALLDEKGTEKVLEAFQEYCSNRGFLMDPDEALIKRRKRTIVYTAKNESAAAMAQSIFEANDGKLYPLKSLAGLSNEEKKAALADTFKINHNPADLGAEMSKGIMSLGAGLDVGAAGKTVSPPSADTKKKGLFGRRRVERSSSRLSEESAKGTRIASLGVDGAAEDV